MMKNPFGVYETVRRLSISDIPLRTRIRAIVSFLRWRTTRWFRQKVKVLSRHRPR